MTNVDHFDLAEQTIEKVAELYTKNAPMEHVNMWVAIAGVHAQLAQVQQEAQQYQEQLWRDGDVA